MGLGNRNSNSGNKGSNWRYEYEVLRTLTDIAGASGGILTGVSTEATLQQVLSAIQAGTEFEARLIQDAINGTWLEVRTWNTDTSTWNPVTYYPAGSNTPGSPEFPITYLNPTSVLAQISSNTTGLNLEVTQLLIKGILTDKTQFTQITDGTDDLSINTDGSVNVKKALGTSSIESSVVASGSSVPLLAANPNRIVATIRNDGTGILYVSKTGTATVSAPVKLLQDGIYIIDDYDGALTGIWTAPNGNARIEETV